MRLEKFWFSGMNREVQDKRMHEEVMKNLNDWTLAKSRIDEELANKYERVVLASDPTKIAVMSRSGNFRQHT
jgi:hypothetical protein